MLILKADLCCSHLTCQISRMWCVLCIFEKQQCLLVFPKKGIKEGLFRCHKHQHCVEKQTFSDHHLSSYCMSWLALQVLTGSSLKPPPVKQICTVTPGKEYMNESLNQVLNCKGDAWSSWHIRWYFSGVVQLSQFCAVNLQISGPGLLPPLSQKPHVYSCQYFS